MRLPSRDSRLVLALLLILAAGISSVSLRAADELPVFATDAGAGLDEMLSRVGTRRIFLLGDATHGTREFYLYRQQVTRRLITDHGVRHVVIEFEPDEAAALDRWISQPVEPAQSAAGMLVTAINRWPQWLWANAEVAGFLQWLRRFNRENAANDPVRIHGMDLKDLGNEISGTYRQLIRDDPYAAWNFRAEYMAQQVMEIAADGRTVVWAHNNHVGDKRADDVRGTGLISMGQLLRQRAGEGDVFALGSAGGTGGYVAAAQWGNDWQVAELYPPLEGSLAHLLSTTGWHNPLLLWDDEESRRKWDFPIFHRGIGVTYPGGPDDLSVYVSTRIGARYDAVVFFRESGPVSPLQ